MKPSFLNLILFGLLLSVAATVGLSSAKLLFHPILALNITFAAVSLIYIGYVLFNSPVSTGRMLTMVCVLVAFLGGLLFAPSDTLFAILLVFSIWLIRSLYYHLSFFGAFFDALICLAGYLAAIWALTNTSSWFMTFWCFFLVQSLIAFIPKLQKSNAVEQQKSFDNEKFTNAHKNARDAVNTINRSN